MTPRHVALALGAVLVLGVSVYLMIQVRSTPASAEVEHVASRPAPPPPPAPPPTDDTTAAPPAAPPAVPGRPTIRMPIIKTPAVLPPEKEGAPSVGDFVQQQAGDGAQLHAFDPKMQAVMDEANKAYDRGDFEEARSIANRALASTPGNVRMLRILVSASCILGETSDAQRAYSQLPKADREQMKVRCARYGMTFNE